MSYPGGLPPRRPDQYRQPITPGLTPGSPNVIRARQVIVAGPRDGVFVYPAGTIPALGNPPIVWITGGATLLDPFGNVLPSTAGVAGTGTFQAGTVVISSSGQLVYSSTPALGNLIASITPAAGSDDFTNVFDKGINAYQLVSGILYAIGLNQAGGPLGLAGLSVGDTVHPPFAAPGVYAQGSSGTPRLGIIYITSGQADNADIAAYMYFDSQEHGGITNGAAAMTLGQLNIGASATVIIDDNHGRLNLAQLLGATPGAAAAGPSLYANASGSLAQVLPSGLAGVVPASQSDLTGFTNATTSFNAMSHVWPVPAGDPKTGTVYTLTVTGSGTQGSTQEQLNMRLSLFGTTAALNDMAGSPITASGNFWWKYVAEITITDAVNGKADISGTFTWSTAVATTATNAATAAFGASMTGLNFATGNNITLQMAWASITGGPTITSNRSKFTRESV